MPVDDPATANAIRRHEERLAKNPESLAFAQLADLYRKAGRPRDAIAVCRTGLSRYPYYTTARLILAKALVAEGDPNQALSELEAILEQSPKDVQCHRLAAEIHRSQGRIDASIKHLESAIGLDPGDRESRAVLSVLRAEPAAGEDASSVARLLRDDLLATMSFGTLCLDQGCVEEAAQVFSRVLRRDPDNREARDKLAQAVRARLRRKG